MWSTHDTVRHDTDLGDMNTTSIAANAITADAPLVAGPEAEPLAAELLSVGRRAIAIEAAALLHLEQKLDASFALACQLLLRCKGRVVVTGLGKSGHVGKKVAATLASTGTPAFFVHPAEAGHGDLGMITPQDVVLAISNSGNSPELLMLLPALHRLNIPVVAMVGSQSSNLAREADVVLDVGVEREACPLNLAPTASTTAALAMGDALAVALLEARHFTADDFARSHPSGTLGRRLILRVSDLMRTQMDIPAVTPDTKLAPTLATMSAKGLGMTTVVDSQHRLLGIFTDGDLRRALDAGVDVQQASIGELMTRKPLTSTPDALAIEALEQMESRKVTALAVVNSQQQLEGVVHLHDLLRAGLV